MFDQPLEMHGLQQLTEALAEAATPSDAARAMAGHGRHALGAAVGFVVFLSADGSRLELAAVDGFDGPELDAYRSFPADADLPACDAVRRRQPVLLPDPQTRLALYPHLGDGSAFGFKAWAAIPLTVGLRALGALTLSFAEPRAFSAADRELMMTIARQSAQTVERARLFESERQARAHAERVAAQTRRLQAVTTQLSRALPAEQVARIVLEQGASALDADTAAIWLVDASGRRLGMLGSHGYPRGAGGRFQTIPLDAVSPLGAAVTAGEAIWLEGAAEYRRRFPESADRVADVVAGGEHAVACVPLEAEGRVLGGLAVAFHARHRFDQDERTFLMVLADHCAQALERTRLFEEERLARERVAAANKMLQAVISASPAGIWLADPDGTVRLWNPAAERMFGWSAANVMGRFLPVVPDGERAGFLRNLARVAGGESIVGEEVRRVRRDGTAIDVQLWGAPVAAPDGRVQCLFVVTDITERKRAEAALRAADQRKDEFLAMLGHELRNPLAPILTAVELMDIRGDASTERERRIIGRQLRHLVRLVDDLLDVSRITRGRIELRKERVDLKAVLARAVEMTAPALDTQRHRLHTTVPDGLVVEGDADRLAQVFANLLGNAARYTPSGGRITLEARAEGSEAVVTVADDGIGIAPELLADVFELFVQGSRTSDRAQGGLGIGLTLVRSMVERHGGRVEAHSEGQGRGSRFTVRLPTVAPASAAEPPEARPAAARQGLGRRVLVVDDNQDALELMAEALGRQGFQVTVANDALSALMAARASRPEVAVLDIGLPEVDGYELAASLRRELGARPLRLIALSGYGQDRDREKSRAAGFEAHFVKPVDLAALEHVLRQPAVPEPPAR